MPTRVSVPSAAGRKRRSMHALADDVAGHEILNVTVLIRCDPSVRRVPALLRGRLPMQQRVHLDHAAYAAQYGAAAADAQAVRSFASRHGIEAMETDLVKRTVMLRGTVS